MTPLPTPGGHAAGSGRGGEAAGTPLLSVRNLCKHYTTRSKGLFSRSRTTQVIKACDDITFDLYPGETLGLVGESGSGKTTLSRCLLRALRPTSGQALFRRADGSVVDLATLPDRDLRPLRTELQMIFQDPFSSLNPRMTVQDIVAEPLVIHRLALGAELNDRVAVMLRRVGIRPEHRTRYPHAFSGGQRQRIGIARALIMRPRLIVCDEAVSALDLSVRAQVINLLLDLQQEFALTYLFIAHDLSLVRHTCNRVAVMHFGKIVELAPTEDLFTAPQDDYTRTLLRSIPVPDPGVPMLPT